MEKIYSYRPARYLSSGKNSYVVYSVVNPETGRMVYRRIKLNYIKGKAARRQYANELIIMINAKLSGGYNPFTDNSTADKLVLLSDAVNEFLTHKRRAVELHSICAATYADYLQHLTALKNYLSDLYMYRIKAASVNAFLDMLYIEKQVTAVTRNHYLQSIKTFFTYCKNRDYISTNPAATIAAMKTAPKRRQAIPPETLQNVFNYLKDNDKYYLFACYLLYACFIRPSEMCRLKISAVSFKQQTIYIDAEISKNKKAQTVTIPKNLILMMIDLNIHTYPSSFYLVGHHFAPSLTQCSDKILRRRWLEIRQTLSLPSAFQFYSLKDSGITQMIEMLNVAEVRDQARHHSISITDVYTNRAKTDGNGHIKNMIFSPGSASGAAV